MAAIGMGPVVEGNDETGESRAAGRDPLDLRAVDRIEAVLDDIDLALRRLDEGTYGRCMHCGEPIPSARLDTNPTARSCARHPELSEQAGITTGTSAVAGPG